MAHHEKSGKKDKEKGGGQGGHGGHGGGGGHGFPTETERDPQMKAVADLLRAAGKAEEFKGLAAGGSLSLSASGRLFGADGSSVSVSITKGTHGSPTPTPTPAPAPSEPAAAVAERTGGSRL